MDQRVKSLMGSIAVLKAENTRLKTAAKSSTAARATQKVQRRLREAELVVDVLKDRLRTAASLSRDEVDRLVIEKTVGGPKRFRPKTREEMSLELKTLDKKYNNALVSLRAAQSAVKTAPPAPAGGSPRTDVQPPALPAPSKPEVQVAVDAVAQGHRVVALQEQLAEKDLELEAKDVELADQAAELEELHTRVAQMRALETKVTRKSVKHAKAKEGLSALQAELVSLAAENDSVNESNRRLQQELRWLQGELDRAQQAATLSAARHADRIKEFEEQLDETRAVVESRKQEVAAATAAASEDRKNQTAVSMELSAETAAKRELMKELDTTKAALSATEAERDGLATQVEGLMAQLETLTQEANTAHEREEEAQAAARKTAESLEQLKDSLEQNAASGRSQAEEMLRLQAAANESSTLMKQAQEEAEAHGKAAAASAEALNKLQHQVQAARLMIKQKEDRSEQLQADLEAASTKHDAAVAMLQSELERLQEENSALAQAARGGQAAEELAAAQAELEEYETALMDARQGLGLLNDHVSVLEARVPGDRPPRPELPPLSQKLLAVSEADLEEANVASPPPRTAAAAPQLAAPEVVDRPPAAGLAAATPTAGGAGAAVSTVVPAAATPVGEDGGHSEADADDDEGDAAEGEAGGDAVTETASPAPGTV